ANPNYSDNKLVLVMVGLPARGKSYLSNKIMNYLKWLQYNVKVFSVGQLKGTGARHEAQMADFMEYRGANFVSSSDARGDHPRNRLSDETLEMLIAWLNAGGNVGIHNSNNGSRALWAQMQARVAKEAGMMLIFVESICDDPAVLAANVALKVSSGNPKDDDIAEQATADFLRRIREYDQVYETITEPHLSYIRITNVGREVTVARINGYLCSRIAFYLMNLHLKPRSIFFSRHGESQDNVEGKLGGDSPLSPRGLEYAKALPSLIKDHLRDQPLTVWTSTLRRTIQTAEHMLYPKFSCKSLDELDAGVCDGMKYQEIAKVYPEDFATRDQDKFNFRYRGGESYRDLVSRLEPVILELERQESILIVAHQAVIRCLYAYFRHLPQGDLPYIKIPPHTLIKLTPQADGCDEERYAAPISAVDTYRAKPGDIH
ncbi:histidine phosphatase superfamily, partial [Mycena leptocephala]